MPSKTKNPLAEAMRELKADPTPAARPVVRTTLAGKAKPRRGEGTRIIAGHFDVAVHQHVKGGVNLDHFGGAKVDSW